MTKAILLGSIGVLVDTSDMQREAFNEAFREGGLDWHWTPEDYAPLLKRSGGRARIERMAAERGEAVDAAALHARKSEIFQREMAKGIVPRPGIREVIAAAREAGVKLGFVTTTSDANVSVALAAAEGVTAEDFDFLGHAGLVETGKPAPDIYHLAMKTLGVSADEAIAVEDSAVSSQAAIDAGLRTIFFPGRYHADETVADAHDRVERLTPALFGL